MLKKLALVFCFVVLSTPAPAAPLLAPAVESQLETWLSLGDLTFSNIYTKQDGDTATEFHAAADGAGATITLFEATDEAGTLFLLGGYNPQSWRSVGSALDPWNYTPLDADRTGFIFDAVNGVRRNQKLSGDPYGSLGVYQTANSVDYGPVFGGGGDLFVQSNLIAGYEFPYSYGAGIQYDGDPGLIPNVLGEFQYNTLIIGELEVYTFAPTAVPEPASFLLFGSGLLSLGAARRRMRGKKVGAARATTLTKIRNRHGDHADTEVS